MLDKNISKKKREKIMKLYVIRHGETEMGKNEIIATEDEPLNKFGMNQAQKVIHQILTKIVKYMNTNYNRSNFLKKR